ncbi:hypothetical protein M0R04_14170 [Candidatus Dojkabacteria bacterium]|jgi:hypothetical protein|nr:hypothetical protein [Candidatus Dojkabacteria bacterium]
MQPTEQDKLNKAAVLASGVQTPYLGQTTPNVPVSSIAPVQTLPIQNSIQTPTDTGATTVAGATSSSNQFLTDYQKMIDLQNQNKDTSMEDLIKSISGDLGSVTGRGEAQLQAEQSQGLPQTNKELVDLNAQILEKSAAYEKLKTDIEAGAGQKGLTTSAVMGQQGAVARQQASEIGLLQARALGLQGQAKSAQDAANRAVDLMFQDREAVLNAKLKQIELIQPLLTAQEKKRTDALNYALGKEATALAEQKQTQKDIEGIGLQLAQFGVDPSIIKGARTVGEALQLAGTNLVDPKQKYEIAKLKAETEKAQTENYYLNLYGGMTPSQYSSYVKDQKKAIEDAKTEEEKSRLQGEALGETVNLMEGILKSPGLAASVGTTGLSRTGTGRLGTALGGALAGAGAGSLALPGVGTVVGGVAGLVGGLYAGSPAELSGAKQNFIGSVEQMISQKFLNNLIDVKAQGATFGALQKAEQDALTEAATKIGNWRIRDKNDKVIGYNIDEGNFRTEMNIILRLTKLAKERATGKQFSPDEESVLNAGFGENSNYNALSPGQFYQ